MGEPNLQPAGDDRETPDALYALMVTVVRRLPRDMTLTQLFTISTLARAVPALVHLRELDDLDREPRRASQPSDASGTASGEVHP